MSQNLKLLRKIEKIKNNFFLRGNIPWKTADEIFDGKYAVIKNGIGCEDIYQAELGDCYFLSSVSAIAEYPNRIKRILLTQKTNKEGIFAVALNYCGVWKKIHLDSYFPTKDGKRLIFAHNDDAEIWAMLLEKAYAKLFYGYYNIVGGVSYRALHNLTGAPGERFKIKTASNQLWNQLSDFDKKKYIMCTGCKSDSNGLQSSHAYSLIGVHEMSGERVVELRNPWGSTEWKGAWGDDSKKWTPSLRKKHHPKGAEDDGRFFMSFNDYCRHYEAFDVCYYNDNYTLSSFNDELDSDYIGCYKATVSKGDYYVILSQEDPKAFNPKKGQSKKN